MLKSLINTLKNLQLYVIASLGVIEVDPWQRGQAKLSKELAILIFLFSANLNEQKVKDGLS